MKLAELNNLDLQDAANWPRPVKLATAVLVFGLVIAGGWYLDWNSQAKALKRHTAREAELRQGFELRQQRAASLAAYQQRLIDMEASFGALLSQLPSQADVPKLLDDISQTGLANGLEFELFRPQAEVQREFHAELPIAIRARGSYHQFARFISDLANLPRIVTVHDISIQRSGDGGGLTMELLAKTYWYLDDVGAQ